MATCQMCGTECGADGVVTECRTMPGDGYSPSLEMLERTREHEAAVERAKERASQHSPERSYDAINCCREFVAKLFEMGYESEAGMVAHLSDLALIHLEEPRGE